MARTIAEILSQMETEQASQAALSELTSPSATAIHKLFKYIVAASIWIHEVLWDKYKTELETIAENTPVGTDEWVRDRVLEFQYDSTDPQIVTLTNYVPAYEDIDETKRIITRASVKTLPTNTVSVKVAKNDPPEKLDTTELNSLTEYLDTISFAGTQYEIASLDADLMYVGANIIYNGQYAATITAATVTAIETYMTDVPFDGSVRLVTLMDAIQSVPGVIDVIFNDVTIRPGSGVAFANRTFLVSSNTTVYNKYPTYGGYVVNESSPYDLASTLTFSTET